MRTGRRERGERGGRRHELRAGGRRRRPRERDLTVATVGGGTALGTSRECLEVLGCAGAGCARKFAEIVAATLLAGEISMAAAIASGEFVAAHEKYGRNRPAAAEGADR
ncbi:MAG: hypothetical protein DMF85_13895 [Acidobacteria bacterium]|nr:MAG: hypothetical protein DMF85_13895 [Acidobacteriota bacterium]